MQKTILTLRIPVTLKRRIKASAQKSGKSGHRWSVEVLSRAVAADEPGVNWAEHFTWLRRHGKRTAGSRAEEVIKARR